jgi:predicted RND superfamily exporter protein
MNDEVAGGGGHPMKDRGCNAVKSSMYYIWMKKKDGASEYKDYLHLNEKAKEFGMGDKSYVFKRSYLHSSTSETMASYMLSSLFITIVILFLTMLLFTDTVSCVFITLMIIFVDCDLLGMMFLLGINISPVSFVCLIMSSGLAIDYCVHIGHAFTHCTGVNPNVRMGEAVKMMGTRCV